MPFPHSSSALKANTGTQTHDKHRLRQTYEHTMHAVLRKRSDPEVQRGDSGKRKLEDSKFLRVRWFCFRVEEMESSDLNLPVGTTWERVAVTTYLSGSLRPLS